MISYCVTLHPGSGLGAQFQQFMFLNAMGRKLGWTYKHSPWSTRRLDRSVYDLIGVDQALCGNQVVKALMPDQHLLEVTDDAFLELISNSSCESSNSFLGNIANSGDLINLKFTTWQKCKELKKILVPNFNQIVSEFHVEFPWFRSLTLEKIRAHNITARTKDDFIVVVHIRRGDTTVLPVGGKLLSCWQLSLGSTGDHEISVGFIDSEKDATYPPVSLTAYIEALEIFFSIIENSNLQRKIKIVVLSDGYKQAEDRLLKYAETLGIERECISQAIKNAEREFMQFEKFSPHATIIGEDTCSLLQSIYWIANADAMITGTGSFVDTIKSIFSFNEKYSSLKLRHGISLQSLKKDIFFNSLSGHLKN